MSSSVPVSQQSNQTMVTFVTQPYSTSAPVSEERVFDFEISREAQQKYEELMSEIQYALLDGRSWTPSGGVDGAMTTDLIITSVKRWIALLNSWSRFKYVDQNGVQQESIFPSDLGFTASSTMSRYMAQGLDTLIRTLSAAGFNPLSLDLTNAQLTAALAAIQEDDQSPNPIYNIRSVLSTSMAAAANAVIAGDSSTQSQSIQQLLMVDYVSSGNEILYNEMNALQTAVNLNQNILSYLNSLQDLMNQKDPQHFLMQLQQLNAATPNYAEFEKETFGDQVLGTVPKFTSEDLNKYITLMQIQSLGLDPNDPLVQAQYGLIENDIQRLALLTKLTTTIDPTTGEVILPLNATIPPLPSSIITELGLTPYDEAIYEKIVMLRTEGKNPMDVTVQTESGLTSAMSTASYIRQTYGGNPRDWQAMGLLTVYGLPTSGSEFERFNTVWGGYHYGYANVYGLDATDTNLASQYEAVTLVNTVASNQAAGIDPLTMHGLRDAEIEKIKIIQQMSADLGLTGSAFSNYIYDTQTNLGHLQLLQQYGLTRLSSTYYPPTQAELDACPSDTEIISQITSKIVPTLPDLTDEIVIANHLTGIDYSQYLQMQDIVSGGEDPTDPAVQARYGLTNVYSTLNYIYGSGLASNPIELSGNEALLKEFGLAGVDITELFRRYQNYFINAVLSGLDYTDSNIAAQFEGIDLAQFIVEQLTADPPQDAYAGLPPSDITRIDNLLWFAHFAGYLDTDPVTSQYIANAQTVDFPTFLRDNPSYMQFIQLTELDHWVTGGSPTNPVGSGLPSDTESITMMMGMQPMIPAVFSPTISATIPQSVIDTYHLTAYDQQLFTKMATASAFGFDITDPAVKYRFGLSSYYASLQYIFSSDPTITDVDKLFPPISTPASEAILSEYGLPTIPADYLPYKTLFNSIASMITSAGLSVADPDAGQKARLLVLCQAIKAVGHPLSEAERDSLSLVPGDRAAIDSLISSGIDLTVPPTDGNYSTLLTAFAAQSLIGTAGTPTPVLGTDSVHVLLNLQIAGLMEPDKIDSTKVQYGLTDQDITDYAIIVQIQSDGKDPTDPVVQAEYGLVPRNTNLTANYAVGTFPQAFIDVISGQFNGEKGLEQIIKNLNDLIDQAKDLIDPKAASSVVTELNIVLQDFETVGSIEAWVQNFIDENEGTYQAHLNNAVVASQALNDTEREQLQQVMFVYQQFYQSAASMLAALNQLLQTIASNIASR